MIIAVDFDNVLYDHDGQWRGGALPRGPVPGAAEAMRQLAAEGHRLVVFSTRGWLKAHRERMGAWLSAHDILYHDIARTKPNADVYLDDKALRFTTWPAALSALRVPPATSPTAPRVLLYRVGRNLNRAYRTCASFGVEELLLLDCEATLAGPLFSAAGRVAVTVVAGWPDPATCLALETFYPTPLAAVDWAAVETLVIGGETAGLPRGQRFGQTAHIPGAAGPSLTVEAALAVALYQWRLTCNR